jgi:hypothetical protein
MSKIDLGATLYSMHGLDGLRGLFTDKQINEWKEAERTEAEIRRNYARMREADLDFMSAVVDHVRECSEKGGDTLVIVPGPIAGYMAWLMQAVAEVVEPSHRTRDCLAFGLLRLYFRTEGPQSRGMFCDHILLHDDVSWRTYQAVMPSLRRN